MVSSNFLLNSPLLYYLVVEATLKQKKFKFKLKILKHTGLQQGICVSSNGRRVILNLQTDERSINKTVIKKYVNFPAIMRIFAPIQ